MEGAGSIRASNWLYSVAPKDGTVFGTVSTEEKARLAREAGDPAKVAAAQKALGDIQAQLDRKAAAAPPVSTPPAG